MKLSATVIFGMAENAVRVRLPNGHEMMGIVPKRLNYFGAKIQVGDRVCLVVAPFGMSKGVLISEN